MSANREYQISRDFYRCLSGIRVAFPSGYCSLQLAGAAAALSNDQPEMSSKAMGNSSRNIIEISFPEFEFVMTIVEDCSPSFQSWVAFLGSSWKIGAKGR